MSGSKLVAKRGHTLAQTLWAQWLTDATARLAESRTVYSGLSSPASNNPSPNQSPAERRLTSVQVASEQVAEREAVMPQSVLDSLADAATLEGFLLWLLRQGPVPDAWALDLAAHVSDSPEESYWSASFAANAAFRAVPALRGDR